MVSPAQGVLANHAIWVILHRVTPGPVSLMGYFTVGLDCSLNESSLLHSRAKELYFTLFSPYNLIYPAQNNDAFDLLKICMLCRKH